MGDVGGHNPLMGGGNMGGHNPWGRDRDNEMDIEGGDIEQDEMKELEQKNRKGGSTAMSRS